jgi:hypothetical protein
MFGPQDVPASLRQGDIIADLFFPVVRQSAVKYLATRVAGSEVNVQLQPTIEQPQGSRRQYLTALTTGIVAHGAVISQCCDLDRTHPKTSFVVCRLLALDRAKYRNVESLIENVDPYGAVRPHLQFFYLGEIAGLQGDYIADFALTLAVPWGDYDFVLQKKILQMDQLHRNKFRVKVGAHYGRPTPEDAAQGFGNPYLGAAPDAPIPQP